MKLIILLLIPFSLFGQGLNFMKITAQSTAGNVQLNETYINIENLGVHRVDLVHLDDHCFDLLAWKWIDTKTEYYFDIGPSNKIFLIVKSRKTNKIKRTIKILKYSYQS